MAQWKQIMTRNKIYGLSVIYEFVIMHNGWETDNYGWITEDGSVWATSHGQIVQYSQYDLQDKIVETQKSLWALKEARHLAEMSKEELRQFIFDRKMEK